MKFDTVLFDLGGTLIIYENKYSWRELAYLGCRQAAKYLNDSIGANLSARELAGKLLRIRPDIPIILCTGYSARISKETSKESGIADYFMKPFDTEQLLRSVRKVLDRRKPRLIQL